MIETIEKIKQQNKRNRLNVENEARGEEENFIVFFRMLEDY